MQILYNTEGKDNTYIFRVNYDPFRTITDKRAPGLRRYDV